MKKQGDQKNWESNFDGWIHDETGGMRKTADLGVREGKWPNADEIRKMSTQLSKTASGTADVARTSLQFLDPAYFDPLLFFIQHRDRKELNFRLRYYTEYHPYVGNIIDLHSSFPLSDFRLQCADNSIQRDYEYFKDRVELLNLLKYMLKDFWMLGEVFPYGRWSDTDKTWDYFTVFPPEKMELRSTYVTPNPIMILQVDDQLKRVVNSADEVDQKIVSMMDPMIVDRIKSSNYITIPSWQISHFANKISMTDLRGTSIIKRALKDLVQEDSLRLLHYTVTQRHTFPLKVFKLGNPACFEGDHYVLLLRNGYPFVISFEDLWEVCEGEIESDGFKEVKNVSEHGYETISLNEKGEQQITKLTHILRERSPENIAEVSFGRWHVRSSTSHNFMWLNPYTLEYEKADVQTLQKRTHPSVVTINKLNLSMATDRLWGLPLTKNLAYFIGMWTGDGDFGDKNSSSLKVTTCDTNVMKRLESFEDEPFLGKNPNFVIRTNHPRFAKYVHRNVRKTHTTMVVNCHRLKQSLLDYYGFRKEEPWRKSTIAKLPSEILFNKNPEILGSCLAGLMDSDGSIGVWEVFVAYTTSIRIAQQITLALLSHGIRAFFREDRPERFGTTITICGRKTTINKKQYAILVTNTQDVIKYYNFISPYMASEKKKKKFFDLVKQEKKRYRTNGYTNTYDIDDIKWRTLCEFPCKVRIKRKRVTIAMVKRISDPKIQDYLLKFQTQAIRSINLDKPKSAYVYNLMLDKEPHTYLSSGTGWILTRNTGWIPGRTHFENLRQQLIEAAGDPDYSILYHHGLQIEYIGAHDKVANLIPEFEFCQKRILAALFANDALIHGSAATYANSNVSVRILMHRYLAVRNQLELLVNNKIFLPVAKARGYYVSDKTGNSGKESVNRNGKYFVPDLPKMRWSKLNLIDDTSQKNFIMRLLDKNVVPHKLIAEIFDLEENDLLHQLKLQQGTVADPVYNKAREAAATDETIRKQVLQGKKTDEWQFPEKKADKEKKPAKKPPRETLPGEVGEQPSPEESAETAGPGETPGPGAGSPTGPAAPAGPATPGTPTKP